MGDAITTSIERARIVRVRQLELPVQEPEVLVAAKLTGQKVRPQDELDIAGVLQSGVVLDDARLRRLVAARSDRFEIFLEIRRRILEE
jgi:hypothetical protein